VFATKVEHRTAGHEKLEVRACYEQVGELWSRHYHLLNVVEQ
jgi:hypothetical protein